jgi:predicted YcjX-like family ATPase
MRARNAESVDNDITLAEQIAYVKRELALRRQVYLADSMKEETQINHEIAAMEAVLATLEELAASLHEGEIRVTAGVFKQIADEAYERAAATCEVTSSERWRLNDPLRRALAAAIRALKHEAITPPSSPE